MLSQITHACAYHTHARMHACMHTHTLHTSHTKQTKQSMRNTAIATQRTHTGMPVHLCKQLFLGQNYYSNHRRSHGERLQNAKFHNNSNTTKQDKDSWAFASPVNTTYHIDVTTGSAPCRSPDPQYTAG